MQYFCPLCQALPSIRNPCTTGISHSFSITESDINDEDTVEVYEKDVNFEYGYDEGWEVLDAKDDNESDPVDYFSFGTVN
jgi:hypothetical protein